MIFLSISLYPLFHLLRLPVTPCVYNMYRWSHRRCSWTFYYFHRKTPNKTTTNHHWINHLQTLHTHAHTNTHTHTHTHTHKLNYVTSLASGLSGSSQTSEVIHLPFAFHLIKTRNKNIKPYIHPAFLFRSATPGTKRRTDLICLTNSHT